MFLCHGWASHLPSAPSIRIFCGIAGSKTGCGCAFPFFGLPAATASLPGPCAWRCGLVAKGALRLVERTRAGHVVEVRLPGEIRAVLRDRIAARGPAGLPRTANLEEMDFLQTNARREAIHARERSVCFYCLRRLTARVRCLDHVVPLVRRGSNSYRNLVSSCAECNSLKGETPAEGFLRLLYRDGRLTATELTGRLRAVKALAAGKLRPALHSQDGRDD